jgi:hypothetical protein
MNMIIILVNRHTIPIRIPWNDGPRNIPQEHIPFSRHMVGVARVEYDSNAERHPVGSFVLHLIHLSLDPLPPPSCCHQLPQNHRDRPGL